MKLINSCIICSCSRRRRNLNGEQLRNTGLIRTTKQKSGEAIPSVLGLLESSLGLAEVQRLEVLDRLVDHKIPVAHTLDKI